MDRDMVMKKYPRLTAHVICESLGYATPELAAVIVAKAKLGEPCYCEWLYSCYNSNARMAVHDAIRRRRFHKGPMAEYRQAIRIVRSAIGGNSPEFASWF